MTSVLRRGRGSRGPRRGHTHRQRGQVLRRRLDVPAEVELIDLPEGDDVHPGDVGAAHLRGGGGGGEEGGGAGEGGTWRLLHGSGTGCLFL